MATAKQIPHLAGLMTMHQEHLEWLSVEGAQEAARNPAEFMKCAVEAWNGRMMKDLLMLDPRFRIDNEGIIHFTITSDGTTGPEWIERLERHTGNPVGEYAKSILRSPKFKPTNGVTTNVDVLPGKMWDDAERTTKNIRVEAGRRKMTELNAEAACLIRMMFTDAELETMGLLWIITMHDPMKDSDGRPSLLSTGRLGSGPCLSAYGAKPDYGWYRKGGFAFGAPQV